MLKVVYKTFCANFILLELLSSKPLTRKTFEVQLDVHATAKLHLVYF